MLLVITVVLVALAALNAIFTAWATVLDARHATALTRALGATPRQVSAGLAAAQVLRRCRASCSASRWASGCSGVANHGESGRHPAGVVASRRGAGHTLAVVGVLTAIPARIGALRPVSPILQSETA